MRINVNRSSVSHFSSPVTNYKSYVTKNKNTTFRSQENRNGIKFSNLFARITRINRGGREFSRIDSIYVTQSLLKREAESSNRASFVPPDNGRLFEIRSIVLIETEPCVIASCGCYNYRYVSDIAYCGVHKSWEKTDRHNEL